MIEATMVAELIKYDPTYQPVSAMGSLDPAKRMHNVREYKRRLPDGRLIAKLRHTIWAITVWWALGMVCIILFSGGQARS